VTVFPHPYPDHNWNISSQQQLRIPFHIQLHNGILRIDEKTFVFLVVFDYYSVFQRKNPIAAVQAFRQAFKWKKFSLANKYVNSTKGLKQILLIKSSIPHSGFASHRQKLVDTIDEDPRIYLIEEILSDDFMQQLQRRCDCYVSLHRSEGFGLNILQAMITGTATIATNYSGNIDFFIRDDVRRTHFPVAYKLVNVSSNDGGRYASYKAMDLSNIRWADPDIDQAAQAMKNVAKYPPTTEALTKAASLLINDFGASNVGKRMLDHLRRSKWNSKMKASSKLSIIDVERYLPKFDDLYHNRYRDMHSQFKDNEPNPLK
jgi:glycosyltransferase involved in cell wall biosynthesis